MSFMSDNWCYFSDDERDTTSETYLIVCHGLFNLRNILLNQRSIILRRDEALGFIQDLFPLLEGLQCAKNIVKFPIQQSAIAALTM
jgi:hypothetical protein